MLLGGFGFLSRLHGLSIDNLVEVEVVLADGSIVIANEQDHPGQSASMVRIYSSYLCCRPLVGDARRRPRIRYCDAVQSARVSRPRCLRWKSHLVRYLLFLYLRMLDSNRSWQPLPPRDGTVVNQALP
jgi:hypothetical protein